MISNLTDITLVVDRSGSKQQRRDGAEGGVNAFIQQQAEEPEKALLLSELKGRPQLCQIHNRQENRSLFGVSVQLPW